ncbi:MAG TPA: hypothetical protein VN812_17405 [Candidatus Acidoferrales bacterium]|nr:hypothetical protein [Candidatus Acidoferrales bacterium]
MGTRRKSDQDEVTAAFDAVESIIGGRLPVGSIRTTATEAVARKGKNPLAVSLGELGASKGGKARAAKLSDRKRKEIAKKAARARWGG